MKSPPTPIRRLAVGALVFFVLTVALGLTMRWDVVNGSLSQLGFRFANLRHAHSHAGYWGVLTLGWWIIERRAGLPLGRRLSGVYMFCALVATTAFAFVGYRPLARRRVCELAAALGAFVVGRRALSLRAGEANPFMTARLLLSEEAFMCRAVKCNKCGKQSWAGCGAHVEQVLGHLPKSERCQCKEQQKSKPSQSKS